MKRIRILGVPIDNLTKDEALEKIEQFIISGQPHQITTVNAEFVLEAQTNQAFRETLAKADLALADSTSITWAARFQDQPLAERIPGADLVNDLAALAEQKHWSLYLIGGQGGTARQAAEQMKKDHPKLLIKGAEEGLKPEASSQEIDRLVKRIHATKPDILLVAFGAPKQELFISQHKKSLNVPVMIGVGGTFDFLAGKIIRAPSWLRSIGLEWLWRLIQQPSRWRRILNALVVFPYKVITDK